MAQSPAAELEPFIQSKFDGTGTDEGNEDSVTHGDRPLRAESGPALINADSQCLPDEVRRDYTIRKQILGKRLAIPVLASSTPG